jgi:hypothetical protein
MWEMTHRLASCSGNPVPTSKNPRGPALGASDRNTEIKPKLQAESWQEPYFNVYVADYAGAGWQTGSSAISTSASAAAGTRSCSNSSVAKTCGSA